MKCPVCGNEKFIEPSIDCLFDRDYTPKLEAHMCLKCGYIYFSNSSLVGEYNSIVKNIKEIEKENAEYQKEIDLIDSRKFDARPLANRIRSLERQKNKDFESYQIGDDIDEEIESLKKQIENKVLAKGNRYYDLKEKIRKNKESLRTLKQHLSRIKA